MAMQRKQLEKQAVMKYETELLDEIAQEEQAKREAAQQKRREEIKARQAFQEECEV